MEIIHNSNCIKQQLTNHIALIPFFYPLDYDSCSFKTMMSPFYPFFPFCAAMIILLLSFFFLIVILSCLSIMSTPLSISSRMQFITT